MIVCIILNLLFLKPVQLHDIEKKKKPGQVEEVITADRARVWEQGDTLGGAELIRNIKK